MNDRQEKYKANRIAGMNPYNAGRAAEYSESYCRSKVYRLEKAENGSIRDALEQAGLTSKYQANKLFKLTQATKIISCNIFIDKDGNMKKADGKSLDFIEVDDPSIQLKALEHIADLKKQTSNTVVDQSQHKETHITINKTYKGEENPQNRIHINGEADAGI